MVVFFGESVGRPIFLLSAIFHPSFCMDRYILHYAHTKVKRYFHKKPAQQYLLRCSYEDNEKDETALAFIEYQTDIRKTTGFLFQNH